jgi:aryl-alcohol dehydrogenase-like predicted oxidoreductase
LNLPGIASPVRLGSDGLIVSRLGLSGHYHLPPAGFARAAEAGVNWFFWEPNYLTLTEFSRSLSDATRRGFYFVAGTFEAEGRRIRADVERALRQLQVEQLGLFLIFWVQSWDRMTDELRDTVAKLKAEGKVKSVGLSLHNRPLLVRAMQEGWNPVMARHSAGHRGAETAVFPFVPEGTSLITFNNLCYGRLLQPVAGLTPPAAADCYRYTLGFPQVSACWSAPATLEQLEENLAVLRDPELSAEKREALLTFGAALYRDEKVFEKLVRMT